MLTWYAPCFKDTFPNSRFVYTDIYVIPLPAAYKLSEDMTADDRAMTCRIIKSTFEWLWIGLLPSRHYSPT